jgi:hypothetical protein
MNPKANLKKQLREQYISEALQNLNNSYSNFQETNELNKFKLPLAGAVTGLVAVIAGAPILGIPMVAISTGIAYLRK